MNWRLARLVQLSALATPRSPRIFPRMVAQAQSDINTFPAIYKSMNEYDAIGCIHGVYMCPGYKSNARDNQWQQMSQQAVRKQ